MRARFTELLLDAPTRDLREGFALARDLGSVAAPALFAMVGAEKSNMRRRMSVFCAAVLAEGSMGDDRALLSLDERSPMQDRLCANLLLALGPVRERPQPDFWQRALGRNLKEPVPLLLVAALLASSRFPGAGAACPQALLRVEDPGVVAAALFAGAPLPEPVLQSYLRQRSPDHASLAQRAFLLRSVLDRHDGVMAADALSRASQWLGAAGESNATLREAAALAMGLGGVAPAESGSRPEWKLLQLFASDERSARSVHAWLPATPQPLYEPAWPRLAVAYALSREPAEVVTERAAWSAAPSVRRHVAIALAMRLCSSPRPDAVKAMLPDTLEWAFVRWASGEPFPDGAASSDATLQQAAAMAREDRLPRAAARALFEDTLWRWGSHPGLGLRDAQHDLVRDLLIAGSLPGNRYAIGLPDHLRYLPAGLGDENDFFGIAVEAWEFLRTPTLPMPAECRLR